MAVTVTVIENCFCFSALCPSLLSNRCKAIESCIGRTPPHGRSLEITVPTLDRLGHVLAGQSLCKSFRYGLDLGYIHVSGVLMEHGLKGRHKCITKEMKSLLNDNGEVILFC